jgi:hypothetical protein
MLAVWWVLSLQPNLPKLFEQQLLRIQIRRVQAKALSDYGRNQFNKKWRIFLEEVELETGGEREGVEKVEILAHRNQKYKAS